MRIRRFAAARPIEWQTCAIHEPAALVKKSQIDGANAKRTRGPKVGLLFGFVVSGLLTIEPVASSTIISPLQVAISWLA
jgi:hypothetical protein